MFTKIKALVPCRVAGPPSNTTSIIGAEPPSRYPPSKLITEPDAVTLRDIDRVSTSRAAFTLKRIKQRNAKVLLCESKMENDEAALRALQDAADDFTLSMLNGVAYYTAKKALKPIYRYLNTRFQKIVENVTCWRCENSSRLFYTLRNGTEFLKTQRGWMCQTCAHTLRHTQANASLNIGVESPLSPLVDAPLGTLVQCRTLPVSRRWERRQPHPWMRIPAYRKRLRLCRALPIAKAVYDAIHKQ